MVLHYVRLDSILIEKGESDEGKEVLSMKTKVEAYYHSLYEVAAILNSAHAQKIFFNP